ncbi:MAG TPA: hypothetical protein VES67_03175 [Vicinamibacterales bacterium]|nr:hypothetical protein [Vicinamibacterales bacterium]
MHGPIGRVLSAAAALAAVIALPVHPEATAILQTTPALLADFQWRNIGPANMAGRVTDIEAVDGNFSTVLVGAASGGVWKSTNAGTTWEPIFDRYGTSAIGDVAFFQPNPEIIWVGTGETCVRNSVSWGDGIYKSTDGGKNFTNMGLRDTHHIGDVVTHPADPNIVYVAAQGHLWGHTGERGVFKTIDGGKTWQRLAAGLPDDGRTGANELKMDPKNPNVLYATFWQRVRQPHRFDSGGPNGGIYKTTDAGKTWQKLTNGMAEGPTGKIGLSIHRSNPSVLVAIVEHGFQPAQNSPDYADLTRRGSGIYRSEDAGKTWRQVSRFNNRPFYYSHIYVHPTDPKIVYVLTTSASVSTDGGATFSRQIPSMGGDFHALWQDPNVPDRLYVGNDKGAYLSFDEGETLKMFDNMAIGQFYAVTLDNRDPYYVYGGLQDNGNWGGPSNSRDVNGILNDHWFKFHSGDGFHATVDPNDWRTVYTETQGGNIRRLDAEFRQTGRGVTPAPATISNYAEHVPAPAGQPAGGRGGLAPSLRFNWSAALTLSPHDSRTLLFGGNHLFRSTDRGDTWTIISPDLSTNNPELTNRESGGITRDVTGAETHATIVTISESPITPGLIWVGTDDGNVQLTRDSGKTWTNTRGNIPEVPVGLWVSRVEASRFAEGTAYVSFDGHRSDNFAPWIFKTTDHGRTWTKITTGLPANGPVYVVKEGLRNPNLLFAGTETSVYATIDGGRTWMKLANGLPTVPVHDLVIHPRDLDLVAGTHGRSVWILDDITPLEQLSADVLAADAHVFQNRVATLWRGISRGATRGHFFFAGRNPLTMAQPEPGNSPPEISNTAAVHYHLKTDQPGTVTLQIQDATGSQVHTAQVPGTAGMHRYFWNLRFGAATAEGRGGGGRRGGGGGGGGRAGAGADPEAAAAPQGGGRGGAPAAGAGSYVVQLTVGGRTYTSVLRLRDDPAATDVR